MSFVAYSFGVFDQFEAICSDSMLLTWCVVLVFCSDSLLRRFHTFLLDFVKSVVLTHSIHLCLRFSYNNFKICFPSSLSLEAWYVLSFVARCMLFVVGGMRWTVFSTISVNCLQLAFSRFHLANRGDGVVFIGKPTSVTIGLCWEMGKLLHTHLLAGTGISLRRLLWRWGQDYNLSSISQTKK